MRLEGSIKALSGWLMSLMPAAALAVGVPATQLPALQVSGQTDASQLAQADASSAGVVTQEQIENRPISRPAEVLEVVPGLVATQHSGDGKANQYFLRGFNLDHGTDLSTFIDGVPNNLRTHGHGQGYNDLNGLMPELIDTIEYRKGPYYAEDGDFSSAGSVHIRYKDRLDDDFYQLTAGGNAYGRAVLGASGPLGTGSWLGAADLEVYDGPWDKSGDERKVSLLGRYTGGDATQGYHVNLMAYHNQWQSSDQIPQRAVDEGLIDAFGQIDPFLGGETSRYTASGDYHAAVGPGHLLVNAYAVHYNFNLYSNITYFLDDPVHGDEFEQRDNRNYYGGVAKYVQAWNTGGIAQELSVGIETRLDDIGTVGLYHTQARERIGTVRQDSVEEGSVAAFVSYSTRWTDWFRSVIGARYDYYDANVESTIAENSGTATDNRPSPKLSLIFGPWKNTEVFANIGRGFHSNDARGGTLRVDPNDSTEPAASQELLVPTTGEEIGVRTSPADDLTFTASFWRLKIGSELVFAGDGGTTEPSFPSTRSGIELSAYYRPVSWLLIDADYAPSRARFSAANPAGKRIPNAVERAASVGAEFSGPGRWFGGLRYRFLGPAPLIEDDSARSHSTTIVNAEAGYRLTDNVRMSIEVLNLLDSEQNDITYFYDSQLADESSAVSDYHFHLVEPRQVRVTLRGTF
jgi:outer membrane receptor protein involved in Fe transport